MLINLDTIFCLRRHAICGWCCCIKGGRLLQCLISCVCSCFPTGVRLLGNHGFLTPDEDLFITQCFSSLFLLCVCVPLCISKVLHHCIVQLLINIPVSSALVLKRSYFTFFFVSLGVEDKLWCLTLWTLIRVNNTLPSICLASIQNHIQKQLSISTHAPPASPHPVNVWLV